MQGKETSYFKYSSVIELKHQYFLFVFLQYGIREDYLVWFSQRNSCFNIRGEKTDISLKTGKGPRTFWPAPLERGNIQFHIFLLAGRKNEGLCSTNIFSRGRIHQYTIINRTKQRYSNSLDTFIECLRQSPRFSRHHLSFSKNEHTSAGIWLFRFSVIY